MLQSEERHLRYVAFAELSRHGDADAMDAIWGAAADDEIDRYSAASALDLKRPLHLEDTERFVDDPSSAVRRMAFRVIESGLFDYDDERHEPLDVDVAYELLARGRADVDPSVRVSAERVSGQLDQVADEMREERGGRPTPGSPSPSQATGIGEAARAYFERLVQRGLVEIESDLSVGAAVDAVLAALAETEHRTSGQGAAIADALVDVAGVVDVFGSDEELEQELRGGRPGSI